MTRIPSLALATALTLAALLAGCTSAPRLYRPVARGQQPPDSLANNPIDTPDHGFAVIEFDDQGELWQREQLDRTMDLVQSSSSNGPITLVIFVHGWKHDASDASSNLRDFHRFTTNLAAWTPTPDQPESPFRKVVGVYVGWRGNVMSFQKPPPAWLAWLPLQASFYDRKATAAQVAGVSCTEAILSLAALTRVGDAHRTNRWRSRVIVIGHSFGGLVVERAVTQAMLGNMLANAAYADAFDRLAGLGNPDDAWRRGLDSLRAAAQRPPADLVLLVNPASEALAAKKMVEALENNPLLNAQRGQAFAPRPWIVSVTSKGDTATGSWFPLGRNLGSLTQRLRRYPGDALTNWFATSTWGLTPPARPAGATDAEYARMAKASTNMPGKTYTFSRLTDEAADNANYQRTYYSRTAGHEKSLRSHTIVPTNIPPPMTSLPTNANVLLALMSTNLSTSGFANPTNQFVALTEKGFVTYTVRDHGNTNRQNSAYWIMDAPIELIADHNSIFTTNFYALAAGLTRMSAVFETNAPPPPPGDPKARFAPSPRRR